MQSKNEILTANKPAIAMLQGSVNHFIEGNYLDIKKFFNLIARKYNTQYLEGAAIPFFLTYELLQCNLELLEKSLQFSRHFFNSKEYANLIGDDRNESLIELKSLFESLYIASEAARIIQSNPLTPSVITQSIEKEKASSDKQDHKGFLALLKNNEEITEAIARAKKYFCPDPSKSSSNQHSEESQQAQILSRAIEPEQSKAFKANLAPFILRKDMQDRIQEYQRYLQAKITEEATNGTEDCKAEKTKKRLCAIEKMYNIINKFPTMRDLINDSSMSQFIDAYQDLKANRAYNNKGGLFGGIGGISNTIAHLGSEEKRLFKAIKKYMEPCIKEYQKIASEKFTESMYSGPQN